MDPALQELQEGAPEAEIEAVIRLHNPAVAPPQVRLVAQFGRVATCRLFRRDIAAVWNSGAVASLKAARLIAREPEIEAFTELLSLAESAAAPAPARFAHPTITGRGTVVGIADWGFDFTHPNFLHPDGSTRFLAIWDQSAPPAGPSKYGYGRVYSRAEINAALRTPTPFQTLGYHPAKADPGHQGTHGTHVLDIAAGGGQVGRAGLAPGAQLIAVHMAADGQSEHTTLGDSVRLLEALDFIGLAADSGPVVVNLSMGRHGGPHDGRTLVEQALDAWLEAQPGRAVVQSSGNYYQAQSHASGRVGPGQRKTLEWIIDPADATPNELEVWYSGHDRFGVEVALPGHPAAAVVPLGEKRDLRHEGRTIGRVYHRAHDPNNGGHHLDIFTYRHAPAGTWQITLVGDDVSDGRFHAWIERDAGCPGCQSRFGPADVDPRYTTGTICNGFRTLAVGAYDERAPAAPVGSFSSSGPTANGRVKPDLAAPGVGITAARSSPAHALRAGRAGLLTQKSGTSMAAPHVTGTIALLFEAAGRLLPIDVTRRLLLANTDPAPAANLSPDPLRYGQGLLNPDRAVAAALALTAFPELPLSTSFAMNPAMETSFAEAVQPAGTLTQQGQAVPLQYDDSAVVHQAPDLDAALRQALASPPGVYLVIGDLAGGTAFRLFRLSGSGAATPTQPPGPVIDYAAPAGAAALVAAQPGGGRVFLPANVVAPTRRWVEVPRLREFYALAAPDQAAQKTAWAKRLYRIRRQIAVAGIAITPDWLRGLGVPVLRLLLAQHAAHALPVHDVNEPQPARRFLGARVDGLTQPSVQHPAAEPACYLRVMAGTEGKMEAINAYDLGAGISLGPIQFNAQRNALMHFLGNLQRQDPDLFQQEFGTPLGWSVRRVGDRTDLIANAGQANEAALVGDVAHQGHNIGFLESGRLQDSAFARIDAAFRRRLAGCFRNVVAWPHAQELLADTAAWWLTPGLRQIEEPANGIPALDPANPDRDTFMLKALLLSAYVRYSACLGQLLERLRPFGTAAEKLAHLRGVLATETGSWGSCTRERRQKLIQRLFDDSAGHLSQHRAATAVFAVIQRLGTTPAASAEAWDDEAEGALADWSGEPAGFADCTAENDFHDTAAAPCGCGGHAAPAAAENLPEADWATESCVEGCGSACGAVEDTFYEDYLNPLTAFVLGTLAAPLAGYHAPARKDDDEAAAETFPEVIAEADWEADDEAASGSGPDGRLVALAEVSLDANPGSVAALLQRVVFTQSPAPAPLAPSPAAVFDAFLSPTPGPLRQQLSDYLTVVALPREVLTQPLRPGDVVLHRAYGEDRAYAAVVVVGDLIPFHELGAGPYWAYAPGPGHYVHVVEAGPFPKRRAQTFVRRVTDAQHRLAHDHLILRPRCAGAASGLLRAPAGPGAARPGYATPAFTESDDAPDCARFDLEKIMPERSTVPYAPYFKELVPNVIRKGAAAGLSPEAVYCLIVQAYAEQSPAGGRRTTFRNSNGQYRIYNEHAEVEYDSKRRMLVKPGQEQPGRAIANLKQGEVFGGQRVALTSPTFVYDSPGEAIADHIKLLKTRWRIDLYAPMSLDQFARLLQQRGYGTDPDYAKKVVSLGGQVKREVKAWIKGHTSYLQSLIDRSPIQINEDNHLCTSVIAEIKAGWEARIGELQNLGAYLAKTP